MVNGRYLPRVGALETKCQAALVLPRSIQRGPVVSRCTHARVFMVCCPYSPKDLWSTDYVMQLRTPFDGIEA